MSSTKLAQSVNKTSLTAVIFDWDGTLVDSVGKIVRVMQHAAQRCELPVPSRQSVCSIIGISLVPAIAKLFCCSHEQAEQVAMQYKQLFLKEEQIPCQLFDGIRPMLEALSRQQVILAVATGKARRGLERSLVTTATQQYFAATRTACEAESKPSPDMLLQLCNELSIEPTQAVMVGDTEFDLMMATAIDMPAIGVSYGAHGREQLVRHQPLAIADNGVELHHVLNQHLSFIHTDNLQR